jgi:hypothetical protein
MTFRRLAKRLSNCWRRDPRAVIPAFARCCPAGILRDVANVLIRAVNSSLSPSGERIGVRGRRLAGKPVDTERFWPFAARTAHSSDEIRPSLQPSPRRGEGASPSPRRAIVHRQVVPSTARISLRVTSSTDGFPCAEYFRLSSAGKTCAGQQCAFAGMTAMRGNGASSGGCPALA